MGTVCQIQAIQAQARSSGPLLARASDRGPFSISFSGPNAKNLVLHGMSWQNQQLFWNREGIAKSGFASLALRSAEVKLRTENYFVTSIVVGVGLVKTTKVS